MIILHGATIEDILLGDMGDFHVVIAWLYAFDSSYWRRMSLPRVLDSVWFLNPVRVLLLSNSWQMRKGETRIRFILHAYSTPRRLIAFADVVLSETLLVSSCHAIFTCYFVTRTIS